MGRPLYRISEAGAILNAQQFYYILGIGHQSEVENFNYANTFIDFYTKQVLPASVDAKLYTI